MKQGRVDRGRLGALGGIVAYSARRSLQELRIPGWLGRRGATISVPLLIRRDLVGLRPAEHAPLGSALSLFDRWRGRVRPTKVARTLDAIRARQVGAPPEVGVYVVGRDRVAVATIPFRPSESEPTEREFERHVQDAAQDLASALAVAAVDVRLVDVEGRVCSGRASPRGLPPPGPAFDAAVSALRGQLGPG